MNGLALFAGVCGAELGLKLALGSQYATTCYVEQNRNAARCIVNRQRDGLLDPGPIWDDVATFDPSTLGPFDIISGGWPCQGFSTATRGRPTQPDLYPQLERIVYQTRPSFVFLENVQRAPWTLVESSLRGLGYRTALDMFCPCSMGAPLHRKRVFLLAYSDQNSEPVRSFDAKMAELPVASGSNRALRARNVRVDAGSASRMDRLRLSGEGIIPAVAARAFVELSRRLLVD